MRYGHNDLWNRSMTGLIRQPSRQTWAPGMEVKAGFVTATVVGRMRDENEWLLVGKNGAHYVFANHQGLSRLHSEREIALAKAQVAARYAA